MGAGRFRAIRNNSEEGVMDDIELDDIEYSTTGWNGLVQANFEKITDYINNKLNPDLTVIHNDVVVVHDGSLVVNGG